MSQFQYHICLFIISPCNVRHGCVGPCLTDYYAASPKSWTIFVVELTLSALENTYAAVLSTFVAILSNGSIISTKESICGIPCCYYAKK